MYNTYKDGNFLFMSIKNRKKINASGKYPCDICKNIEFLESHHINGRKIKNYNKPWNIANICPSCHYKVHLGQIIISGWFDTTNGKELIFNKINESKIVDSESTPHIIKTSENTNNQ